MTGDDVITMMARPAAEWVAHEARSARVEAAVRLLLDSGDITPQGARILHTILESAS